MAGYQASQHPEGCFSFILLKRERIILMTKKIFILTITLTIALLSSLLLGACASESSSDYETKIYYEDTELGEGSKTLTVRIEDTEKSVTFTVHTDKTTVGAALLEHNIISGEDAAYGMYIKSANGTVADFDTDQSYWAFYIGEDYATSGVDSTNIEEGVLYRLVYTK